MLIEGGGGGGSGRKRPSRDEYLEAATTLVAFVGFEHEDSPKNIWGGRTAAEARAAVLVVLGLTSEEFDCVLFPDGRDRVES